MRLASRVVAVVLIAFFASSSVSAPNRPVHQDIVEYAYETLLYVSAFLAAPRLRDVSIRPPDGVDPAEWNRFIQAVVRTPAKWSAQPSALQRLNLSRLKNPP